MSSEKSYTCNYSKYSTMAKWLAEFKLGRDSFADDQSPGCHTDVIEMEMLTL